MLPNKVIGQKVKCPICEKQFKITAETFCIAKGGYVCTWKCFNDYVKKDTEDRKKSDRK